MITGLFRRELADRREDAESITSEHNDVRGLPVDQTGDASVWNEINGIRAAGVFGYADVVIVWVAGSEVIHDVLENGTKTDGVKYLWLLLSREIDAFGVAAALNVEHPIVRPNVFVIANQLAVRVCRQGGFSSSREPKEESDISVLGAHVCGGVERKLSKLDRLEVVHDREDPLLHLPGVFCPENNHLHPLEVDLDRGCRAHALGESIGRELAGVVDNKVWFTEATKLFLRWPDQHVVL